MYFTFLFHGTHAQHPGVHPTSAPPQVVYFAKQAEDLIPPGDGDQWMDRNPQSGGLYGPVGSSVGYGNMTSHAQQRMHQGMGYGDYGLPHPPKHNGNVWAHPHQTQGSPLSSPTAIPQGFQPHQVRQVFKQNVFLMFNSMLLESGWIPSRHLGTQCSTSVRR